MIELGWLLKLYAIIGVAIIVGYVAYSYLKGTFSNGFQSPVLTRLPPTPSMIDNRKLFLQIAKLVVVTRILLFITIWIVMNVVNETRLGFFESIDDYWFRWDSHHYRTIAQTWYPVDGDLKYTLVFYPAYSIIVAGVDTLIGNFLLSSITVSNVMLVLASFYAYKLAIRESGSPNVAWLTTIFILIFPEAFFHSIVYTESTFLFFTIASFYYMRDHKWLLAGLFGMLAAFTRNQGILLFIPMMMQIFSHYLSAAKTPFGWRYPDGLIGALLSSFFIFSGLGFYFLVNYQVTGEFFKFLEYQEENWGNSFEFYAQNIQNIYNNFLSDSRVGLAFSTWLPMWLTFVAALTLMLYSLKKVPFTYTTYAVCYLFISYSPGGLLSATRYMACAFPIFYMFALWANKSEQRSYSAIIGSSMMLLGFAVLWNKWSLY